MEEKLYRLAVVLAIASILISLGFGIGNGWLAGHLAMGLVTAAAIMAAFFAGRWVLTGRLRAK